MRTLSPRLLYCVTTSTQLCQHACLTASPRRSNYVVTYDVLRPHVCTTVSPHLSNVVTASANCSTTSIKLFRHVWPTVSSCLLNCVITSFHPCYHNVTTFVQLCRNIGPNVQPRLAKFLTTSVPSSVIKSAQICYLLCQIVSPRLTNCVTTFVHLCHHLCPTLSRRRPTM